MHLILDSPVKETNLFSFGIRVLTLLKAVDGSWRNQAGPWPLVLLLAEDKSRDNANIKYYTAPKERLPPAVECAAYSGPPRTDYRLQW
ncbi:unnamed protein product [Penicillium roqueforti FM164]|uniref:Uncharacterized protein n=1 Tax=Penicillium roqueforti (strain FM164) TaxID=1365484 RepID=W6QKP5_PENRF|nr:unnamed protein product [Penicillium roqueforti FM164]